MANPRPTPTDAFPTSTSIAQAQTEVDLLQCLPDPDNQDNVHAPILTRNPHMQFLIRNLIQGFPARYTSQDASQPWLLFWTVQAFCLLQVELDPGNKQRIIDKIMACQHPKGGFGGGPGQAAHLLPTYAAVCTLAIVGRPGPVGGWDQIDRQAMSNFFFSLKQPDGSFLVTKHAEVDVRGIYCLIAVATLLDLITPSLISGTVGFIASCQTYEGGFASASQPYFSLGGKLMSTPRPTLGEAHGGYTYCAVAAWCLLKPFLDADTDAKKPCIDLHRLNRWLVSIQGGASELGGFKGRTNKLVDGCYSWWCGVTFPLTEMLRRSSYNEHRDSEVPDQDDVDDMLFDRKALQEYILYASQLRAGGLRDKPPKNADAYHTLYCLAGLSAAQHRVMPSLAREGQLLCAWTSGSQTATDTDSAKGEVLPEDMKKRLFVAALSWMEEQSGSLIVGGIQNRLNATHPLFNLTMTHTEAIMSHFYRQTLPRRPHQRKT